MFFIFLKGHVALLRVISWSHYSIIEWKQNWWLSVVGVCHLPLFPLHPSSIFHRRLHGPEARREKEEKKGKQQYLQLIKKMYKQRKKRREKCAAAAIFKKGRREVKDPPWFWTGENFCTFWKKKRSNPLIRGGTCECITAKLWFAFDGGAGIGFFADVLVVIGGELYSEKLFLLEEGGAIMPG